MALWHIEKISVSPTTADPLSKAVQIVLRDTDTNTFVTLNAIYPTTTVKSASSLKGKICTDYAATYTPNDWECA